MRHESLGLDELKGLAKSLGFTKIQCKLEGAPVVPLTDWNGFRPDGVSAYSFVGVLYSLRASTVAAHKPGEPDIYYDLF